ncbi:MAG: hypothetical protein ACLRVU_03365 [Beduini sp.]|uniref:hypothetical protein n=1 Tax=Beduini sp. TaxID=1922300 RepID=UPI0039A0EE6D
MWSKKKKMEINNHNLKTRIHQLEKEKKSLNDELLSKKEVIESSIHAYQAMLVQLENAINAVNTEKRNAEKYKQDYIKVLNEINKLKIHYQNTVEMSIKDIQKKLGDHR